LSDKDGSPQGLEIIHDGHRTRLKWHRLRRSWDDPLFSAQVMAEGFRLGASMELDLKVRADGGFVVLHDDDLSGETTGQGEITRLTRAQIEPATFKDGRPLVFSEELASLLSTAHPDALLQFDMKDTWPLIGERGVAHLRAHFSDLPCAVIVSCGDLDLIVAVREQLPNLLRGIDPTDKLVELIRRDGWNGVMADLEADLTGPTAPDTVYLEWHLVLEAAKRDLDLIALCQRHGAKVDAWTFTLEDPASGFSDDEWRDFSALMALRPDQISTDEAVATERAWNARMKR
jgi:glycerophosphoryl diester phosphodiesterase